MRPLTLTCALSLAACAGKSPSAPQPADAWLTLNPTAPDVCFPAPVGRMDKEARSAWVEAVNHAKVQDLAAAQASFARVDGGEGPASQIAIALQTETAEQAETRYGVLIAAVEADSSNLCLTHTTSMFATGLRKFDKAKAWNTQVRQALPNNEAPRFMEVILHLSQFGGDESFAPLIDAAVTDFPDFDPFRLYRAAMRVQAKDFAGAVEDFANVKSLDPQSAMMYRMSLQGAGDLDPYLRYAIAEKAPLGDNGSLAASEAPAADFAKMLAVGPTQGLRAIIETSEGTMRCDLRWDKTPVTVANFVGLARGSQPWTDPATGAPKAEPYYDGTQLHRVIPEFMIQGGDPTGTGSGGPGYKFWDETTPVTPLDRPGLLAMANSGPNTNGSQWFITEVPVTYLNGKHTVFGVCDEESVQVVKTIARVPRDERDKPQEPIIVDHITIEGF
ncbi:MAG: peptidylprolyl isomerase [Myxococcota bacterium]